MVFYRSKLLLTLVWFSTVVTASSVWAEAPVLRGLTPAGVQQGQTAEVTLLGTFPKWPVEVWTSHAGISAQAAEAKGIIQLSATADCLPGKYLLRVYTPEGASAPCAVMVGTLPEVNETEPNNALYQVQGKLTPLPSVVNGRTNPGADSDVYPVKLEAGQTLIAAVEANQNLGSPMDAVLQVLSPKGIPLTLNDDFNGLDPFIAWTAPTSDTYFVRLFSFPAAPNQSISLAGGEDYVYRLTLTTGPYVDRTLPLAVEQGNLQPLQVLGWNLPEDTAAVTPVLLDERAVVAAPDWANSLSLELRPGPIVAASPGVSTDTAPQLELPVTLSGTLAAPTQVDYYKVSAKKDQYLEARLFSRRWGFPTDAVVEVLDSSGKVLHRSDDTGGTRDPDFVYKIPADGDYYYRVSELYQHGSPRHVYLLELAVAKVRYTVSSDTHAFSVAAGEELKIPLNITRIHGHADDIRFEVSGLPEGIEFTPVVSENKGDAAKKVELTLKVPAAFTGPFQIHAVTGQDDSLAKQRVISTVAGKPIETSQLWLTVLPPKSAD